MKARHTVTKISHHAAMTVAVTFGDGFTGSVDLSPLLACGPAFATLADPSVFHAVQLDGITPVWPGDIDIATDALRAWCEAGRFMDYDETESWIERNTSAAQSVA